jgi:error-prone DNA polymerase
VLEEKGPAFCPIRLGFRQVKGLSEEDMRLLSAGQGSFTGIHALLDAGVPLATLEKLADADAFRSMGLDRRQALWEVSALADRPAGIYRGQPSESAAVAGIQLPQMTLPEHVVQDYGSMALSLKAHPVSFVREKLEALRVVPTGELNLYGNGTLVKVAGLVLVRQRPGTASGICFITIEDERGTANLVVFQKLFEKYRKEILQARLLMVEGELQREGEVTHVIARQCFNVSGLLRGMAVSQDEASSLSTLSRADERNDDVHSAPNKDSRIPKAVQAEIFPGGRNFR